MNTSSGVPEWRRANTIAVQHRSSCASIHAARGDDAHGAAELSSWFVTDSADARTPVSQPGWRLVTPADLPFLYELVTLVDPRWWRFSRDGLEPQQVLAKAHTIAAGALVEDHERRPVAAALLADAGASGTGSFEYFARPDEASETLARGFAPALIGAAFDGAPVRRLYVERFDRDARLLGELEGLLVEEVRYPDFAMIAGRWEDRTISVLTRECYQRWHEAQ
jgi:hypothetical protein